MKLRRTTSYKKLPLIIMGVISLLALGIYKNISSIETNPLKLELPDGANTINSHMLPLSVNADGQFLYKETLVNIDELTRLVQQDIDKFEDDKKVTIIINLKENAPIEYVVEVMDMALKMEIGAVLATESN